jgi:hypothetical protein
MQLVSHLHASVFGPQYPLSLQLPALPLLPLLPPEVGALEHVRTLLFPEGHSFTSPPHSLTSVSLLEQAEPS